MVLEFSYINGLNEPSIKDAFITEILWSFIYIVFDLFGWVPIKHKWSLTMKEFYIDYQPWIILIYVAIFLGPLIRFVLNSLKKYSSIILL